MWTTYQDNLEKRFCAIPGEERHTYILGYACRACLYGRAAWKPQTASVYSVYRAGPVVCALPPVSALASPYRMLGACLRPPSRCNEAGRPPPEARSALRQPRPSPCMARLGSKRPLLCTQGSNQGHHSGGRQLSRPDTARVRNAVQVRHNLEELMRAAAVQWHVEWNVR